MALGTPTQFCGGDSQDNADTSLEIPVEAAVPTGAVMVVVIAGEDAAITGTLTDTQSNSYTRANDETATAGGSPIFGAQYYGTATTGLSTSDQLVYTKGASGQRPHAWAGAYVTGATGTPDVAAVEATGTGTSMAVGPSSSTVTANAMAFACYALADNLAVTADAAYTERAEEGVAGGGASTPHVEISTRLLSATGAQTSTATRAAGTCAWVGFLVIFPESGGGGGAPAPSHLLLLGVGT